MVFLATIVNYCYTSTHYAISKVDVLYQHNTLKLRSIVKYMQGIAGTLRQL